MSARGDRTSIEMGEGFKRVYEKLDDIKGDVKDLKKSHENMWKHLRDQGDRVTIVETRLSNCGEISGGMKKCPTTMKLEKVCKQTERETDRGLAKYGLVIALIAITISAVVSLTVGLLI